MRREEFEWLERQVRKLKNVMDALHDFDLSEYESYEVHPWTPLKLICLMWWLSIYTHIIPNYFRNYWYIDLFSGPGLNFVRETGDYLPGSPILACNSYKPFTQYIFIEENRQRCKSLKRILSHLNFNNYKIYCRDCHTVISNLHINADHSFIFADCERPSHIKWETIEKLLSKPSDMLIVFHTNSAYRELEAARRTRRDSRVLTEMFGDDSWRRASDGEELLDMFSNKLQSSFKRINFTHPIKIKGRYSYHIILACRKSKGKRDYTDAWIELGEKMTNLSDKHAKIALKICQGQAKLEDFREFFRQRTLENFI